jgi:hydroxypyruvate isomerase
MARGAKKATKEERRAAERAALDRAVTHGIVLKDDGIRSMRGKEENVEKRRIRELVTYLQTSLFFAPHCSVFR